MTQHTALSAAPHNNLRSSQHSSDATANDYASVQAANDVMSAKRARITPVVLHSVDATVLAYPARLLPMLPVATTLRMWVPLAGSVVAVSTSNARAQSLRDFGQIVFSAREWSALVLGVESERIGPDDLQLFCDAKIDDPDFVLTEELALSGASPDVPQNMSIGEILRRMGAEIVSLHCEDDFEDSLSTARSTAASTDAAAADVTTDAEDTLETDSFTTEQYAIAS